MNASSEVTQVGVDTHFPFFHSYHSLHSMSAANFCIYRDALIAPILDSRTHVSASYINGLKFACPSILE